MEEANSMTDFVDNGMYKFECGCEIPIVNETIKPNDGLPSMEIDYYNINHNCPATWSLFCEGKTKGIFQLEKSLGKSWSEKVKPVSIEEVSALVSLIRPGTLKAIVDGKSMTKHFVDRKNGEEEFEYFHPSASKILDVTHGVIVYQEQTLALAKMFAGFDLIQADMLRRAIGKKKADVMAQCRIQFIEGCEKQNVIDSGDAEALFDIIEKSNRYSFNKCLALDTIAETPNGLKTLDTITIGDKVLAPSSYETDYYVEVTDKIYNGEKELFEVTTETGKTITCTLDHKLMCQDGEMRTLEIIINENWSIMCED